MYSQRPSFFQDQITLYTSQQFGSQSETSPFHRGSLWPGPSHLEPDFGALRPQKMWCLDMSKDPVAITG